MSDRENERIMILRMLEEGKIDAQEALRLLDAVGPPADGPGSPPPPAKEAAHDRAEDLRDRRFRAEEFAGGGEEGDPFEAFRAEFGGRISGLAQAAKEFVGDLVGDLGAVLRELPESGIFRAGPTEPAGRVSFTELPLDATRLAIEGPFDRLKLRPALDGRIEAEAELFVDPAASEETRRAVRLRLDREEGARLRLRVDAPHGLRVRAELTVRIPPGLTVACVNGAGRIETECLDNDLSLETALGSLEVAKHRGKLTAFTKGGAIRCDEIDGDLECRSNTGAIRVCDVRGDAVIECGSGAAEAEAVRGRLQLTGRNGVLKAVFPVPPGAGPHRVETKNGTVTLLFAPGVAATVEATARLGRIALLPGVAARDEGGRIRVEGGGPLILATTQIGAVSVGPAPARSDRP